MSVPFSSALYYPYIDIKNERWLRSAALFWDNIRTVVPDAIREPYSGQLAQELSDEGFLVPLRVSPAMEEIEELTDAVLDFLTDPANSALIIKAGDPSQDGSGPAGDPRPEVARPSASTEIDRLTSIHVDKVPYIIRSHFEHALSENGWLRLPAGFTNFYMTLLATKLAGRLGLGLLTESSGADNVALQSQKLSSPQASSRRPGRHYEATGPRKRLPTDVARGLLVDLIIKNIELPQNISTRSLLQFKRDHREELSLFRREIGRLTGEFSEDLSLEALRQSIEDQYRMEVAPALRSLKGSLRAQRWDASLSGFLKVSFFSAAPTALAVQYGVPPHIALLAGAGVSLTATAVQLANQREQTRRSSPYTYLMSLEGNW